MSLPTSFLVAVITGGVTLVCMLAVTSGLVEWYKISTHEGASGYFVVFWSLLAGVAGALIGFVVAHRVGEGFAHQLLWSVGVVLGLCALLAGGGYLFAPHREAPASDELGLAQANFEAAQRSEVQGEFDMVPPDAPMAAWFPHTGEGGHPELREVALRHIMAKPGYITELNALMVDADRRTAVEALEIVRLLPKPLAPDLKAGVVACGKHLAILIRQVNETPAAADPHYESAGEVRVRFTAWLGVAKLLRQPENGGLSEDFIPELRGILTLSRARPEIPAMRQDVLRVASYYAEKWAGIAPLPGDPSLQ